MHKFYTTYTLNNVDLCGQDKFHDKYDHMTMICSYFLTLQYLLVNHSNDRFDWSHDHVQYLERCFSNTSYLKILTLRMKPTQQGYNINMNYKTMYYFEK